jgi:hypothetical protein
MLPLKQHNPVEVRVDEVQNCVLIVELLRLEQVQEHAAVKGEFSHEHLCAGRGSEGWGGVVESLCRPSQIHIQTVPVGAESFVCDLESLPVGERREMNVLEQLLLFLLSGTAQKMGVEGRLQIFLVHANPNSSKLVAVLPLEAGRLHHAANDGRVKQFLKGSWGDIVAKATSRRVTKLAGEEKIGRTVELHQLVKLVRIHVAKVDLGPRRRQSDRLGLFFLLIILFIPTAITTRGHFV